MGAGVLAHAVAFDLAAEATGTMPVILPSRTAMAIIATGFLLMATTIKSN
jgi:hypothetical protein